MHLWAMEQDLIAQIAITELSGGAPNLAKEPGRARRKQADRSAVTRERVINAAIEVLYRQGYAGATTMMVAATAGVSMGALQHQFPTKAVLMAAVARRFAARRFLRYREALRGVPRGIGRFEALNEASWTLIGSPEMTASIEIELAMRNDGELAAAVEAVFDRHAAFIRRLVQTMLREQGELDDERLESIRLLNSAVMIGLSVLMLRTGTPVNTAIALKDWRALLAQHLLLDIAIN